MIDNASGDLVKYCMNLEQELAATKQKLEAAWEAEKLDTFEFVQGMHIKALSKISDLRQQMEDLDKLAFDGNKELRREVAILRRAASHILASPYCKNGVVFIQAMRLLTDAVNDTQATAKAYEREVVDNFIGKLRGIPSIGLSERQFGELRATNKGKEIV